MLTAQLMANMDDDYLVAALHAEANAMTSTDIECELLARFENLLAERAEREPLEAAVDSAEIDTAEVPKILEALAEFNCWSESDVRQKLERADKFYGIANDSGDVISRMNDLINSTL